MTEERFVMHEGNVSPEAAQAYTDVLVELDDLLELLKEINSELGFGVGEEVQQYQRIDAIRQMKMEIRIRKGL